MADLKQLEFYVLRYVPHLAREEFINIGVLLFELRDIGFGFSDVRMTNDWRRVYCLDRQVDIEVLQRLGVDLRMHLQHPQDMAMLPRKLEDSFATSSRSPPEKCVWRRTQFERWQDYPQSIWKRRNWSHCPAQSIQRVSTQRFLLE